jgi:hypothetical protein
MEVLNSGNGGTTHAFDTYGRHSVNARLRSSKSMVQGVGGSTIGLATAATAVAPSSTAFEAVESKADDLLGLSVFWTLEIGQGRRELVP